MNRDTKQVDSMQLSCSTKRSQGTQFNSKYCPSCRRETIPQRLWRWFGVAVWRILVFALKCLFTLFVFVYLALMLESFEARDLGPLCAYWPQWIDSTLFEWSALLLEKMRGFGRASSAGPVALPE